jgi:hypothetical protein
MHFSSLKVAIAFITTKTGNKRNKLMFKGVS